MKLVIALIASLLFVSACSTHQNPLEGVSDKVNDGNLPETNKPIAEKPLDKMNLQIDAPTLVNAAVGNEVKFNIAGRVLVPGIEFVLYIDNLDQFPGATFNPATGDFSWMPTRASIGTQVTAELSLTVTIATVVAPGRVSTSETKTIPVILVNRFEKPTIKTLTGDSAVIGGMSYTYTFTMTNKDAVGKNDITIIGQSCGTSGRSLTPYVTLNQFSVKDNGNGEYSGELTMDLYTAANLTTGTYCVGLAAVTAQGQVSDVYKMNVTYEPKVSKAYSTLTKPIALTVGDFQRLSFSIYDPAGSGEMSVVNVQDISLNLPGSTITCAVDSYNKSMIYCEALLDARTATPGETKAKIDVSTRRLKQNVPSSHILTITVKAAAL